MKTFALAILGVIGICSSMSAAEQQLKVGEGAKHPKDGFTSVSELSRWAENSSFGGGGISIYNSGGRNVYIVTRSFTSGVYTTEISVYAQRSKDARILMMLLQPITRRQIRTRLEGESILFECYNEGEKKWDSTMTLSRSFFD